MNWTIQQNTGDLIRDVASVISATTRRAEPCGAATFLAGTRLPSCRLPFTDRW